MRVDRREEKITDCLFRMDWKSVLSLVKSNPENVRKWHIVKSKKGCLLMKKLPIHIALRHSAPPEIVKELLFSYSDCVREKDEKGKLLMHLISGMFVVPWVRKYIEWILPLYPYALMTKDNVGNLPLHYIALNATDIKTRWALAKQLIESCPASVHVKNGNGKTFFDLMSLQRQQITPLLRTITNVNGSVPQFHIEQVRATLEAHLMENSTESIPVITRSSYALVVGSTERICSDIQANQIYNDNIIEGCYLIVG